MIKICALKRIAEVEFFSIVKNAFVINYKLRIILIDSSFIDVNISQKLVEKFGFHWETMNKLGSIYRYDNFPDKQWEFVSTYPYHFHRGAQENVEATPFPTDVLDGFRAFMDFVRNTIE